MIDEINHTRKEHILTIEDPIEFVHSPQKCVINQREIGSHTLSFHNALRSALREDPDVILVGELRDLETISLALTAAETGHLVFATLHTNSAPETIDRIIDAYPHEQQSHVRTMLSTALMAVITQQLLKKQSGRGRVAAHEIMMVNSAIRNLIRENKLYQIESSMQAGKSEGMQTMEMALRTSRSGARSPGPRPSLPATIPICSTTRRPCVAGRRGDDRGDRTQRRPQGGLGDLHHRQPARRTRSAQGRHRGGGPDEGGSQGERHRHLQPGDRVEIIQAVGGDSRFDRRHTAAGSIRPFDDQKAPRP